MADLHKDAEDKLHEILSYFLEQPFYGFGMRPIGWWYYKIKAEINALDNQINSVGINQKYNLQSVSGTALYDSFKIDNELYIIVKDFKFNLRKIKNELSQSLTRGDEEETSEQTHCQYLSIFTTPSSKLISDKVIGLKIEMCTYADGTVVLKRKGRNIPLQHQFDKIESGFRKRRNGDVYAIGIKNNKRYRIYIVD
ncbi:MAG: hypothetical protein K2M94_04680, partial [Paramuribaculum sp.]|nr:hypothetical protein [Paramuribaculum sp.]